MNVRAWIMTLLGGTAAVYSVARPYHGLLILCFLYFFRPDLWGAEEVVRPVLWLSIGVLAGWIGHSKASPWHRGIGWIIILFVLIAISSCCGPLPINDGLGAIVLFAKIFLVVALIVRLCDTPDKLAGFVLVVICGNLWFVKVSLLEWAKAGFSGEVRIDTSVGQGGGANYIAWVMATTLPFLLYKAVRGSGWQRLGSGVFILLWIGSIVATGSRGGFVCAGAAVVSALFLIRTWRMTVGVGVVMLAIVAIAPARYWERIQSITLDPASMDASSLARVQNFHVGVMIMKDYPWFGTGFDTFPKAKLSYVSPDYIGGETVAHNTYIQLGAELGAPVLVAFVALNLWLSWRLVRSLWRRGGGGSKDALLPWTQTGVLCGLVATWAQMAKGDMAKFDYLWWLYGMGLACLEIEKRLAPPGRPMGANASSQVDTRRCHANARTGSQKESLGIDRGETDGSGEAIQGGR